MNQGDQFLQELKQIVLDNITNEQFGVEHLSEIIGLSRSHLHRKLKKLKGLSISQFIREIRLEEALELLHQDEVTTTEIAYKVGFNSPSYFHKCFHDHYGYPPSEAKKIYIEGEVKQVLNHQVGVNRKKQYAWVYKIGAAVILLLLVGWSLYNFTQKEISLPVEKSIAVLPLVNLSGDQENQYFIDGLVEDLLSRLASVDEFKVISRTSSDTYRERGNKKVPEIASELGVSYIVEGSVQKHANKARITVQLIDAKSDKHIWFQSFDRDIADVFEVQREIAIQVASEMSTVLTEQQIVDIKKNYTESPKAFELYQLGRYYWGKRLPEDYETAIEYFNKSIIEDPKYALAYAGLGDTYFLKIWESKDSIEIRENRNKAEAYVIKALELDPKLVEAHTVLATVYFFIDWNWSKAESTFKKALKLNPNYSTLHHRYSEFLSYVGQHEEARKHINKALELDPLSYIVREVSAKLYLNRGNFHSALAEAQICEELNKEKLRPFLYQFWANCRLKNDIEAFNSIKKLNRIIKDSTPELILDSIYKRSGCEGLMQWAIDSFDYSITKAQCFAFLGDNEKEIDWLEIAFEQGDRLGDVPYWYSSNHLETDPRFIKLMEKMNLPWHPRSNK